MYEELESNDDLERTDEDAMPDMFRCYRTPDGFEVSLIRNRETDEVLVKLWDNADDAWRRHDAHLLATSGSWIPTERAGATAEMMLEGRHVLQDVRTTDPDETAPLPGEV